MLTQLGTLQLSGTKVWFQLKGVHRESVTADDLARMGHVAIRIEALVTQLDHLATIVTLETISFAVSVDPRQTIPVPLTSDILLP